VWESDVIEILFALLGNCIDKPMLDEGIFKSNSRLIRDLNSPIVFEIGKFLTIFSSVSFLFLV
jgi:hypothetical protein